MTFAAPWLLLALVVLPLLLWLLRVLPPAPRVLVFPAVRLLLGLRETSQAAARTPPWLLALRLAAAGLVIVGLAQPILRSGHDLPGRGPVLLVIDDGWASASDWGARMRSAEAVLARAAEAGRPIALLATAPADDGTPPRASVAMPASELQSIVAVLHPKPWPVDRAAAALALRSWTAHRHGTVAYIADAITDDDAWPGFATAMADAGPVAEYRDSARVPQLMLPPAPAPDGVAAIVAQPPRPVPTSVAVLAQGRDGRTLARLIVPIPAGTARAGASMPLPAEIRLQLDRLVLDVPNGGAPGAGGVALLDAATRARPVGLVPTNPAADTPLSGSLFYLRRALSPYSELREADIPTLLAKPIAVLLLPDRPLTAGPETDQLTKWVENGGMLVRFAGPAMAQAEADGAIDPLLPLPLLGSERELGGALSWNEPAALAPFPPGSPFAGLPDKHDVTVNRQILADPSGDRNGATWARLADGTPLVTQRVIGQGRVVLFHVTANADWSDLPLSGVFVGMLRRLVGLAAGVAVDPAGDSNKLLAPSSTLDGDGALVEPPLTATPITAHELPTLRVSPFHPPGFYGPEGARRALNLAAMLRLPEAAPPIQGAAVEAIGAVAPSRALGPWLLALALALLAFDLVVSLRLRGLTRMAAAGAMVLLAALLSAPPQSVAAETNPALATRLAYVVTGQPDVDEVSRSGLAGLSAFVNSRTAATLADPAAVTPGHDDLSFYPLLYWPITPETPSLEPAAISALNDYMNHGGVMLIDTQDGGGGGGDVGASDAGRAELRRLAQGSVALAVPTLMPLATDHVLARSFYLMSDFPGRFEGNAVWVDRNQDRTNDSVSPVIIGSNDWAAAWAVDPDGRHPYATLPGGDRQRLLAYRFGVNVVMYALTGNYKGDQVHVPALLERLGQ